MKKLVLILLCCCLLCACGKTAPKSEGLPTVLTPNEYVLYTNIFYNQTGEDYVGDTFQKVGVFTRIYDEVLTASQVSTLYNYLPTP